MKTYLSAEKFEEEVAKLQQRADNVVAKVNDFMMKRVAELHEQLDDDQRERVKRRFQAKLREQHRPQIIHPGNARLN